MALFEDRCYCNGQLLIWATTLQTTVADWDWLFHAFMDVLQRSIHIPLEGKYFQVVQTENRFTSLKTNACGDQLAIQSTNIYLDPMVSPFARFTGLQVGYFLMLVATTTGTLLWINYSQDVNSTAGQAGRSFQVFQIDNAVWCVHQSLTYSTCGDQLVIRSTDISSFQHLHIPLDCRLGIWYAHDHSDRNITLIQ